MGKCRGALRSCTTLPKRTDPLAKSRRRRKMPMRPWMVSSSRGGAASSRRIRGQVGNCAKLQEVGWEPGGISQNAARACVWRGFFAISAFFVFPRKAVLGRMHVRRFAICRWLLGGTLGLLSHLLPLTCYPLTWSPSMLNILHLHSRCPSKCQTGASFCGALFWS